jgi:hypothetical protein
MLYSIPLAITLTTVVLIERYASSQKNEGERPSFTWLGTWLPLAVTILFGRAIIFALPKYQTNGLNGAILRFMIHAVLCFLGWLLYVWALAHPPLTGLPPLHHWWAKVLMYLNLCLMALHLMPLQGQALGELVFRLYPHARLSVLFREKGFMSVVALSLVAASPLLDSLLGESIVFPVYELLASLAT